MRGRITVIGSSNVDFIMQVERLPAPGETVTDAVFMQTFGGKGANQAVAAARSGGNVTFLTGLGEDIYASQMLANFAVDSIETSSILHAKGVPCGTALILFDSLGENYIAVAPGANDSLLPEHIEARKELLQDSALIVMQREIPTHTTQRVLELAENLNVPVLFNYAPVRKCEIPVNPQITGLIVNEGEASALTGLPVQNLEQAQAAATTLRSLGPRFVVLTLGAKGVCFASQEATGHLPAFPVTPIDTTAAGDTFCGAFATALTEGKALEQALLFAQAAAALSVTHIGAQPSIPYRNDIDLFLMPGE